MKLTLVRSSLAVTLAAVATGTTVPAQAAPTPGWRVTHRASPGNAGNGFYDVKVLGAKDAWAVGGATQEVNSTLTTRSIVRRWNGSRWAPFPAPAKPEGLLQVAASSSSNVWTVGFGNGPNGVANLVTRWDGRRWAVQLPALDHIDDLEVLGPKRVWISGYYNQSGRSYFRRFDGRRWKNLPAPAHLRSISARADNDIWGIGAGEVRATPPLWHWNGRSWRSVSLPRVPFPPGAPGYPDRKYAGESEVLAKGPRDVWVSVGFRQSEWQLPGTVLLHWNGRQWSRAYTSSKDTIREIHSDAGKGVWLLSDQGRLTLDGHDIPVNFVVDRADALRYANGRLTRRPIRPGNTSRVNALAPIPGKDSLWAAGQEFRDRSAIILGYGR